MKTYLGNCRTSEVEPIEYVAGDMITAWAVVIQAENKKEAHLKLKLWHALQDADGVLSNSSGHFSCTATCSCPVWVKNAKKNISHTIKDLGITS